MLHSVLFDLDGTLVDTAPDLGFALNEMRRARGLEPMAAEAIRTQASHGSQGLIRLGFGVGQTHPDFPELRREFLAIYAAHLADASCLFPGMAGVLDAIEAAGIRWGVVTNKPERFTLPLLQGLGLLERAACVVGGDTCANAKPHPEPVLHACRRIGAAPQACLYVGDAERDVESARAAGMPAIVALYGYLSEADTPHAWGGDGYIQKPGDLIGYLAAEPGEIRNFTELSARTDII